MFCIFDIDKLQVATWVKTTKSVLCLQVFDKSAYWAGPEGILYHWKQNLQDQKVQIINSDEIKECFQTRFKDSITSVSIRHDKILIGTIHKQRGQY